VGKPTLYHNDMSVCSAKVRMALAEKGIAWDGVHLNLRDGDAQKPEYVKLNPNQVVPTLLHNGWPTIESNVICEYIEDAWPETPLRPADPYRIARMRLWMKRLDDNIHAATATVSLCIAFRHQHLKRTREQIQAYLNNLVDPTRQERLRQAVEFGMDSPAFGPALKQLEKLVADMDEALKERAWLADLAYASYMIRFVHLGLDAMIEARPRVRDWMNRLFKRPSYRTGIEQWFNPGYLELFAEQREAARARARLLLSVRD
jgi:glutathione S-transferase